MKIIFFEVPKVEQGLFIKALEGHEVVCHEEKLNEENVALAKDAEVISIFVNSLMNQAMIDSLPGLKFITTRSTGFDHIDVKYCESKEIKVSNVPAYGSYTVAEFAFGLILNLSRKIVFANNKIRTGNDFGIENLCGFDLVGKNLGVIGTGKIGKNVIKIARGFSMNVLAYDLYPDLAFAKEHGVEYKNLDEVLSLSDVVTLHAPYTKDNHHLINKERISLMKKGVYLVNTARGELIDTDALVWALNEGIVAGAGLDVLEGERELKEEIEILSSEDRSERVKDYKTLLEDRALIEMPNVIITPHVAFYSKEAEGEIIKTTIENIKAFTLGNFINLLK